ncbi:MAG: hypothetical protein D6812_14460 [Deltaproteobacteria bacterium]|nr:MAG: hypothetical protein D6812_14460 [Deltaproteobacteria bacterium]
MCVRAERSPLPNIIIVAPLSTIFFIGAGAIHERCLIGAKGLRGKQEHGIFQMERGIAAFLPLPVCPLSGILLLFTSSMREME